MTKKSVLLRFTILLYIIATLHIAALYFSWYWEFWWYDIMMHFLGGFWLFGMGFLLLFFSKTKRPHLSIYGCAFALLLIIGMLWELFEFSLDTLVVFQSNDLVDTVSDIGMDIAGGLVAFLVVKNVKHSLYDHEQ